MINAELKCLPHGWRATTIGDAANIFSGATPSTEVASYWNGAIPWCIPTDITGWKGKYLVVTERSITEQGLVSSGASMLPAGSLLLCSRATIGDVKIAAMPICTNQGFKSLVCKDNVSNEFLYYLIQPLKPRLAELATGSTFRELSKHDLANIAITLPPLSEQRAIAAVLSDMDSLIGALDALIAKKQAVKEATMQRLLTGRTRLPGFCGEWETKRIGDILTFLNTASNPRSDLGDNGSARYIHYGDVHAQTHPVLNCTLQPLPSIDGTLVDRIAPVRDSDLVMVDASEDLGGIGKSIEISGVQNQAIVAGLHTILCRGDSQFWATGFKAYLQFIPAFKNELVRVSTGISVYAISKSQMAEIILKLPVKREQAAIVAVLSDMEAEIEMLERRRDKAEAIKQGMMQELLTGNTRLPEAKE